MTPERIRRYDDERLYQPRIHSRRIRELHRISEETGEPMTVLVDRALQEFIERRRSGNDEQQGKGGGEHQTESSDTSRNRLNTQAPTVRLCDTPP
jgi:hypothetical protein